MRLFFATAIVAATALSACSPGPEVSEEYRAEQLARLQEASLSRVERIYLDEGEEAARREIERLHAAQPQEVGTLRQLNHHFYQDSVTGCHYVRVSHTNGVGLAPRLLPNGAPYCT